MADTSTGPDGRRRGKRRRGTARRAPPRPAGGTHRSAATSDGDLALQPAHPMRRLYAFMLDAGVLLPIFFILNIFTQGHIASADSAPQDILVFFAYFVGPTGIWGRTPGKMLAGIIVVDEDGRTPGIATAIGREMAFKAVSAIIFGLGLLWIVIDPARRGWHDRMAGTFVLRKPAG